MMRIVEGSSVYGATKSKTYGKKGAAVPFLPLTSSLFPPVREAVLRIRTRSTPR
jgi:hypothetical protein